MLAHNQPRLSIAGKKLRSYNMPKAKLMQKVYIRVMTVA